MNSLYNLISLLKFISMFSEIIAGTMRWEIWDTNYPELKIQNLRIKNILKILCKKYLAEENQILLAFILKHPAKILPVIGTSKAGTIKELKQSLQINLESEDWFRILEASRRKEVE